MTEFSGLTEGLTQNLQESLDKVFIPTFLKMILPYVIAIIIFGVIRIISARVFRNRRALKICMDAVIVLAFLAVCGFILLPITTHFISSDNTNNYMDISVPEFSGSDPFSGISMPEYSGSDPFQITSDGSSS